MSDQQIADMLETRDLDRFLVRRRWELAQTKAEVHSLLRGERGASKPSGVHTSRRRRASLSRSDPMPSLFVVGLAILGCLAIFGFISIGQFLQRIWGG